MTTHVHVYNFQKTLDAISNTLVDSIMPELSASPHTAQQVASVSRLLKRISGMVDNAAADLQQENSELEALLSEGADLLQNTSSDTSESLRRIVLARIESLAISDLIARNNELQEQLYQLLGAFLGDNDENTDFGQKLKSQVVRNNERRQPPMYIRGL